MIVVSDTSPLNYLILLDAERILPELYGRVIMPEEVLRELEVEGSLEKVRNWLAARPTWLEVNPTPDAPYPSHLHRGEAAAIILAQQLKADLLLIDDQEARSYAEDQGLRVTGLLGVLRDAAMENLIDLGQTFNRLRSETNFRARQELMDALLNEFERTRQIR